MADQDSQHPSEVADLEPQADQFPAVVPENFDPDTYLRAFPDVAQAIADGVFESPLQHYLEHGQHEERIRSDARPVRAPARNIEGHIDFYGHHSLAGGWIFCGWSAERWSESADAAITAHCSNGDIVGASITAFYRRDGLRGRGVGLLLFIQAISESVGDLVSVDIEVEGEVRTIAVEASARAMSEQDVASSVRPILLADQESLCCRELFMLLSTGGYGRLRRALNTLDGFVDLCGYHGASGGWFFCGWVTRAWDSEIGPDKFIVRFADGNLVSQEAVSGFYPRDDMEGRGIGFVMFVPGSSRHLGSLTSIEVQRDEIVSFIRAGSASQRVRDTELAARLRPIIGQVASLDASVALLSLLARLPYTGSDTLSGLTNRIFLEFDEVVVCPAGGVVLIGWMLAKPGSVLAMRLRSSSMNEPFDFDKCIKLQRPDVIASVGIEHGFDDPGCGFIAFIPCTVSHTPDMYMEVETAQRAVGYRRLPPAKLDGIAAIRRILSSFDVRYNELRPAFDKTIGPAVGLLNRARLSRRPLVGIVEFGEINPTPEFSVVIPLYNRLDYVEYQMAFLSSHAAARQYEFIYVLDDPPKRREAERLFSSVYERFHIPFRALLMEQNVGFAPANNVGLRTATGRYICFMNSDVFPGSPDWLERLSEDLEAHPDLGVVGPMLLYGDGSVQHDGMIFRNLPEFGNWSFGSHPGKGMRPVQLPGLYRHICITGACMMMRRSLAIELGGFDESYVIGDFEDSDLCLRLYEMNLASAVDSTVHLYHLERKSQAPSGHAWRMNLTLYNAWVHEKRWAETIALHPLRDRPSRDPLPTRALMTTTPQDEAPPLADVASDVAPSTATPLGDPPPGDDFLDEAMSEDPHVERSLS